MLLTLVLTILFLVSGQCKQNSLYRLKTYSVPCNPSTYCSHIEVFISVNGFENNECLTNVTLIAYNMHKSLPHSVQFSFIRQNKILNHICTKHEFGGTSAKIYAGPKVYKTGSSIYMNGNLICTWIAQPFVINQPPYDFDVVGLMYNVNYSLVFTLDNVDSILDQYSSELPWYQPGFIECGGHRIYGDNEYRVRIKKETKKVQLWLEPSKEVANIVEVVLIHQNSTRLIIVCNYFQRVVYSFIENLGETRFLTEYYQLHDLCTVILPDTFECANSLCFIFNSTFDLQVKTDTKLMYYFPNLNLDERNSGSKSFSNSLTITLSLICIMTLL